MTWTWARKEEGQPEDSRPGCHSAWPPCQFCSDQHKDRRSEIAYGQSMKRGCLYLVTFERKSGRKPRHRWKCAENVHNTQDGHCLSDASKAERISASLRGSGAKWSLLARPSESACALTPWSHIKGVRTELLNRYTCLHMPCVHPEHVAQENAAEHVLRLGCLRGGTMIPLENAAAERVVHHRTMPILTRC